MIRHTQAKMLLFIGLGRWDEAEELAVDLLALRADGIHKSQGLSCAQQVWLNGIIERPFRFSRCSTRREARACDGPASSAARKNWTGKPLRC